MTADAFTEQARAEAAERFRFSEGYEPAVYQRRGFVAGAEWARDHLAQRELTEVAKRIRELHSPEWIQALCRHPRKGCGRDDCTLRGSTMWGSNQYMHEYGHEICSHCTSGGDPYTAVSDEYPCPTIRAIDTPPTPTEEER